MQYIGDNVLFNSEDGEIIDWLSQFDYPRAFLSQDSTYTLVLYREGELDLVMFNSYTKQGDTGLTMGIWLDFVRYENDLRELGRPYFEEDLEEHTRVWQSIGKQIKKIGETKDMPSVVFATSTAQGFKPHFRYA